MSCNQSNYFPDITRGATFKGAKMTFYNGVGEDKTAMDLTGASVFITFKKAKGGSVVFEFKTTDNTILIPTPTNGEILLAPRLMDYPALNYVFDVKVIDAAGNVIPYFENNWKICQDV